MNARPPAKSRLKLLPCIIFAVTLIALDAGTARAQTPTLQYNFNETGTFAIGTGLVTAELALTDSTGTPSDLHTPPGGGVSGMAGDRAFDNTASTGMGKGSVGGNAEIPANSFGPMDSFTYECWYKASEVPASLARLVDANSFLVEANSAGGVFNFEVNGIYADSPAGSYTETNQWIFFAVTYDGTKTDNNVAFYKGTMNTAVMQVGGYLSLDGSSVSDPSTLTVGNWSGSDIRPFKGYIDDLRLFSSGTDSSGVLTATQLENIRETDVYNGGGNRLMSDRVDIKGIISSYDNNRTHDTLITMPNLCALLGVKGPADKLCVCYNPSSSSYVIASKSDRDAGLGFPLATVLTVGAGSVNWTPSAGPSIAAYGVLGINWNLVGTAISEWRQDGRLQTGHIHALLSGTLGEQPTVMNCKVEDTTELK
jgi:hypothetical protein